MSSTVKNLPHSQLELTFSLDPVKLEVAREAAVTKLAQNIKVPGFRPGKAPKKLLEEHMNPTAAMQTALDEVLNEAYAEALKEHSIVPVVQPQVNISSTDLTKPIEVVATIQIRPHVTIGDWQKIAIAKDKEAVDDKKVEETLSSIFERSTAEGQATGGLVDASGASLTKPEMDDAWAQKLGAKSLEDLRSQVRLDLVSHAEYEAESKWQDKVMEQLISMTKADLPPAFVEDELSRMRNQFEQQLASVNMTMKQYAEQSGKSVEEIEDQWKPQAEKQALMEVALAEIAHQQKIEASEAEVEAELAKAEPKIRAQFADPQQRYYLTYSLWRQKVLRYILETVADNKAEDKKAAKK